MPFDCGCCGSARRSSAGASHVEYVFAAGRLVFGSKTVDKLRAVIDQYLGSLDWRSEPKPTQEVNAAPVHHIAINVHEHPARGAGDGHKRAVLHIIALEPLFDSGTGDVEYRCCPSIRWTGVVDLFAGF